jgi:hypothetical protein
MNKTIQYKELDKINNIDYFVFNTSIGKEYISKFKKNSDKIIYEDYVNGELKKTLEIELETWDNLLNKFFKILKQRNYYWNKCYDAHGDETVFDVKPWKLEIKNVTGEYIEINCRGKYPEVFREFLEIIYALQ